MKAENDKLICPKCDSDWSPGISKIKAMQFLSHKLAKDRCRVYCMYCGATFGLAEMAEYLRNELKKVIKQSQKGE